VGGTIYRREIHDLYTRRIDLLLAVGEIKEISVRNLPARSRKGRQSA
jgi:hypothetical protein